MGACIVKLVQQPWIWVGACVVAMPLAIKWLQTRSRGSNCCDRSLVASTNDQPPLEGTTCDEEDDGHPLDGSTSGVPLLELLCLILMELDGLSTLTTPLGGLRDTILRTKAKLEDSTALDLGKFCKVVITWSYARSKPCSDLRSWILHLQTKGAFWAVDLLSEPALVEELRSKLDNLHSDEWDEQAEREAADEEASRIIDEAHGCW